MKFVYVEYVTSNGLYTGAKGILSPCIPFIIHITTKFVLNLSRCSYYVTNMYECICMKYQSKRKAVTPIFGLRFQVVFKMTFWEKTFKQLQKK